MATDDDLRAVAPMQERAREDERAYDAATYERNQALLKQVRLERSVEGAMLASTVLETLVAARETRDGQDRVTLDREPYLRLMRAFRRYRHASWAEEDAYHAVNGHPVAIRSDGRRELTPLKLPQLAPGWLDAPARQQADA